jgi:hypothetical protein
MQPTRVGEGYQHAENGRAAWYLLLLLTLALAAGVRGYSLSQGPPEFEPVRQYFTAMIARELLFRSQGDLSESQERYIENAGQKIHEPPVMEWLSVQGFKFLGREALWIPQTLAASFWMLGGVFLFLLLRRLFEPGPALVGSAFFLLAPFGIHQSLSFQPDSLMLMAGIAAWLSILRHHQKPSTGRLIVAGLVAAAAITLKAQIVFMVAGVYAGLALRRMSFWRLLTSRESWSFALLALAPPVAYLAFNLLIMEGIEAQRGILPELLLSPGFYLSWLYNIDKAVGYPVFVLGLTGLLFLRGDARHLALGLWAGYVALGLVFTYHFATHPYYHAPILLPVALGLAGLAAPLVEALRRQDRAYRAVVAVPVMLVAGALVLGPVLRAVDEKGIEGRAETFARIGEWVQHSNRTIMLARAEGLPLMYHGRLSGWLWPTGWHRRVESVGFAGIASHESRAGTRVEEEAEQHRLEAWLKQDAQFFVVTFMEELSRQRVLKHLLDARFPVLAEGKDYRIYDLRQARPS